MNNQGFLQNSVKKYYLILLLFLVGLCLRLYDLGADCTYLLLLWLFVPILLPYVISLISTPVLFFRYTIAALMAFYLLAARGIEMTGRKVIMLASMLIILILSALSLNTYYNNIDQYQWREAVGYIEEKASGGDYIAVFPLFEIERIIIRKEMISSCIKWTRNFYLSQI